MQMFFSTHTYEKTLPKTKVETHQNIDAKAL